MPLHYVVGDATFPQGGGEKLLAHICNDRGGWGKGFVLAVSRRWGDPEMYYRRWASSGDEEFCLGQIQVIRVETDLSVVNMVAQHGYKTKAGTIPLRMDALSRCLTKLGNVARRTRASVHMPRIGTGLAGGKWGQIEPLIRSELLEVPVFIYDLPQGTP